MLRCGVPPNIGQSRNGRVMIAGTAVTVEQDGVRPCSYNLKPKKLEVKARQDEAEIEVKTGDGCAWTASSSVPWVTIREGSNGSGDGKVRLRIDENTGPARSTTLACRAAAEASQRLKPCVWALPAPARAGPARPTMGGSMPRLDRAISPARAECAAVLSGWRRARAVAAVCSRPAMHEHV